MIALAVWLGWCGHGWLGGGDGDGDGDATTQVQPAVPADPTQTRCQLRVDAKGVAVDGTRITLPDMETSCGGAGVDAEDTDFPDVLCVPQFRKFLRELKFLPPRGAVLSSSFPPPVGGYLPVSVIT